jgi:hypothetical protein
MTEDEGTGQEIPYSFLISGQAVCRPVGPESRIVYNNAGRGHHLLQDAVNNAISLEGRASRRLELRWWGRGRAARRVVSVRESRYDGLSKVSIVSVAPLDLGVGRLD